MQYSMEIATPIKVLNRFYEEERLYMAAGGPRSNASFDGIASTLDPNVVLHQSPDLPWGGEYLGHAGFREWAAKMSDAFDRLEVKETKFFEKGSEVVVSCRVLARSRKFGSQVDYPMIQVISVVDGKIVDFRPFYWNVPDYVAAT